MTHAFFTIGHSTRSIDDFLDLLRYSEVALVVDVRSVPRSRTNPQYNLDSLPNVLSQSQIGYVHLADLGGLRGRQHDVSSAVDAYWQHASFHNYADYALSEAFRSGLAQLRALGAEQRSAVMCAEAVWWRCHRRIIADYLLAAGETVFHILGKGHVEPATMTPAAKLEPSGLLSYPAPAKMDISAEG
jgi:uncharacterized protein (DUF488 family)